jgi:hypothetical protein
MADDPRKSFILNTTANFFSRNPDDFLKHVNEVVLHTMFYKSFSEEITTHDDYERFIRFGSELISNRFVEEIEKKYNSKHC